jgi:hypothetical protein
MSKNPLANIVPNIELGVGIDKDDVVAIAVSNHEIALRGEKRKLDDESCALTKILDEAKKDLDNLFQEDGDSHFFLHQMDLVKALKGLHDYNPNPQVSYEQLHSKRDDSVEVKFCLEVGLPSRSYGLSQSMCFYHTKLYYGDENPANLLRKKITETEHQRQDVRAEACRIGDRLRDMAALERQAKAGLARVTMEQSEEGRVILAEMDKISPAHMQLPGK